MKRILSFCLAVLFLIGSLPMQAFAIEGESQIFATEDEGKEAPVVSLISAELVSEGAQITFASDQGGTYYCLIQEADEDEPDPLALKIGDAVANARGQVITESAMTVFVQGKLDESKDYIVYLMVENEAGLWSELASLPLTTEDITVIDPDTSNGKNQGIAIDQDLILTMDISEITDRTAVLTITTNQDGTVYYLIQKASIEAPVDLINHSDRISVDVTYSTPWTTVLESLSPNTEYIIYSLVVGNGNPSKIVSQTFTTADTLKEVQPEVTLISAELVSEGVNLTFESNQGGTYYCLIQESYQEAPEALAIKAQQNGLGKATGQVTPASSMTVFVDALLDAGEQYTAYLVAENEKGLLSDVASLPLTRKKWC